MKGDDFPYHDFQASGEQGSVVIKFTQIYHILSIDSPLLTIINHRFTIINNRFTQMIWKTEVLSVGGYPG